MSSVVRSPRAIFGLLLPIFATYLYGSSLHRVVTVLGCLRKPGNTPVANLADIVTIEDTIHCEDLHYHASSNSLFTACEDASDTRFGWFPGLATFENPTLGQKGRGSIHVIDLVSMKSRRLGFENFNNTFVTHGIDVITDPHSEDDSAVYIFAINHVPNPEYLKLKQASEYGKGTTFEVKKSNSRVEIFHHVLGSSSVRHVRTVQDPLITTPNDIFAISPASFYVTNDHYYPEGHMRTVEDLYFGARWSNIVHVRTSDDGSFGSKTTIAMTGLHNNNGLGHGKTPDEILIDSCTSGTLHIGRVSSKSEEQTIELEESIQIDSIVDNPTYFSDPFATASHDASGYVLAGLSRAIDISKTCRDSAATEPVMVWYVTPAVAGREGGLGSGDRWEKRLLFEDDGSRIRSASCAVLVAVDPTTEASKRKAWLFVTGFLSENIIAVKVDL